MDYTTGLCSPHGRTAFISLATSEEADSSMADNRGPWLSSAMALFLVWTALMYVVRVWAKLRTKSWGPDDWTISGSFVSFLATSTYRQTDNLPSSWP